MRRSFLYRPPCYHRHPGPADHPPGSLPGQACFAASSQIWWLPALLVILTLIADFEIIVRRSTSVNPWLLIGFAQGFNVISRLMMVWPNATHHREAGTVVNWVYLILTIISITASWLLLIYTEKPAVREGLLRSLRTALTTKTPRAAKVVLRWCLGVFVVQSAALHRRRLFGCRRRLDRNLLAGLGPGGVEGVLRSLALHHQLAVEVGALVEQERLHVDDAPQPPAVEQLHPVRGDVTLVRARPPTRSSP